MGRGSSRRARIFLHTTLDGFGDAIQMARYIPMVKAMGGHVTLVCYPAMGRLFIQSGDRLGFDCLIAQGARVPGGRDGARRPGHPHEPAGDLPDHAGHDPGRSLPGGGRGDASSAGGRPSRPSRDSVSAFAGRETRRIARTPFARSGWPSWHRWPRSPGSRW